MSPFKCCTFYVVHGGQDFDDEGIIALARLPKLESLELSGVISITSRVFKHFTSLKKLGCSAEIKNMNEVVRSLLRSCSNFQEINLNYCSSEEIIKILKSAAEELKERANNYIPLSVIFWGHRKIRMLPIKSVREKTTELLFQLYYNKKNLNSDFNTHDLDILVKEVTLFN